MARRAYNDHDRTMVAVTLQVNEGNIRKTARETGVPINTVRDWKTAWEKDGYPESIDEAVPAVQGEFLEKADRVRWKFIELLDQKADQASVRDLITGVGVLTDKINVMKGLATNRTEVVQAQLPSAEEIAKELASYVAGTVAASKERHEVIQDADWSPAEPLRLVESNP